MVSVGSILDSLWVRAVFSRAEFFSTCKLFVPGKLQYVSQVCQSTVDQYWRCSSVVSGAYSFCDCAIDFAGYVALLED